MNAPFPHVPQDDHIFLLGRPPIAEFLGFMRSAGIDGSNSADTATLTGEWRSARAHFENLEITEAGYADGPKTKPLPPELDPLAQRVLEDEAIQSSLGLVPTEFAMVELDRVVISQKYINLAHVDKLRRSLPAQPDVRTIGEFTLALSSIDTPIQIVQGSQTIFSFASPSRELRFLDSYLLEPSKLSIRKPNGYPVAFVCLGVGFGCDLLMVMEINGRLILQNGSHRAYCLRQLGVSHAPCVVQKVSNREEYELVANLEVKQYADRYLKSPRPPVLKDYFDPMLIKIVPMRRRQRMVRLQIGVEISDVPPSA